MPRRHGRRPAHLPLKPSGLRGGAPAIWVWHRHLPNKPSLLGCKVLCVSWWALLGRQTGLPGERGLCPDVALQVSPRNRSKFPLSPTGGPEMTVPSPSLPAPPRPHHPQ